MSPIRALAIADLAQRYGVAKNAIRVWLERAGEAYAADQELPEPPTWGSVNNGSTLVVDAGEWEAFEQARRSAGLPLPGERRRGRPPARAAEVDPE